MSVYRIATNKLRTARILRIKTESLTVKAFTFKDKYCSKAMPGQFLMLWIPGIDEIPLSILDVENSTVSVAVKKVGIATDSLHSKKVGDLIGVRGPFGNSFTLEEGRILMVSGGTGSAPILFLAKKLASKTTRIVSVIGARTRDELLFVNEFENIHDNENDRIISVTEDGSYGVKGLVTVPLESLLGREKFDMAYTCGPEQMMRKVFDLTEKHHIPIEASLERSMRCGIGLCGSCIIGKYRVCKDGPVFAEKQLREVTSEFGISKRDFNGKRIPLNSLKSTN